jgi:hypothetical protein
LAFLIQRILVYAYEKKIMADGGINPHCSLNLKPLPRGATCINADTKKHPELGRLVKKNNKLN